MLAPQWPEVGNDGEAKGDAHHARPEDGPVVAVVPKGPEAQERRETRGEGVVGRDARPNCDGIAFS